MNKNILTVNNTKYNDLIKKYERSLAERELNNREDVVNALLEIARYENHFSSSYITLHYFRFFAFMNSEDVCWSLFDKLFTKENGVTIDSLYDEKDSTVRKSIVYSAQFTYYFIHGNYKKISDLFQKFNKEENKSYIDIDAPRGSSDRSSLLISLKLIAITMTYLKEYKDINLNKYRGHYIYELKSAAGSNIIDEYLSDPFMLILHQKIMREHFENKPLAIKDAHSKFDWSCLSLLDKFESDPQFLESFLDSFDPNSWCVVNSRTHYSIKDYTDELDENKERIIKIFNTFLYVKYGAGQRYNKLEKIISEMVHFIEVLGYDEYGILDIVEGLPEKIQRAALKNMVGED